jgi:hypothetical protein
MRKQSVWGVVLVAILGGFPAGALAQMQVVVEPADRDRNIRLQDGRQIRLPAGAELVRDESGRLMVRRPSPQPTASPQPRTQPRPQPAPAEPPKAQRATPKPPAIDDRWRWFVGGSTAMRTVSRDYIFDTDPVEDPNNPGESLPIQFDKSGDQFRADGGTYTFTQDESYTAFGVVVGMKDTQKHNLYQFGYLMDSEVSEVMLSAQWGFESFQVMDALVPYVRVLSAVGFRDGVFSMEANSFAFGLGAGASYALGDALEVYGGLDVINRKWGNEPSRGNLDANTTITYGIEKREDSETRLGLGLRYFF